ncbi:hypothetical protein syc0393_c [Synechococcus elongatus PCC 6301]|uniref:DNA 3'-5' helicase n=1 Tax=Synechococcus sp. (strain ATCC 27144 / PCC 6301 / SAUG 1402/1) TaxID=269084 RepID=A0A0H3JZU9_SYNP6|nr:UvrD-helicase domain-containing protein [Synechococcus elongatus]BAD78583.1 hypothetical protein syc0393_c [Synechococcus elongatus PCC 6301]
MKLTEEQRQAVQAAGSVAVTAGAGTGKTELLSQRYLWHLQQASESVSPLEIVVLTFTEKAAAELRSRIRKAVGNKWPDRSDWLAEVEAAQISTFHSLCARICREHPAAAGQPADFTILDDLAGKLWQQTVLTAAMQELDPSCFDVMDYSEWRPLLETLLDDPVRSQALLAVESEQWREVLAQAQRDRLQQIQQSSDWQAAIEDLSGASWREADALSDQIQQILAWSDTLFDPANSNWQATYDEFIKLKLTQAGSAKNWGSADTAKLLRTQCKVLRDRLRDEESLLSLRPNEADDWNRDQRSRIYEAFETVLKSIDARKRQDRCLDFNDLERGAVRALESEAVRSHYQQRWRYCFVDEFQDTNPTQSQILQALWDPQHLILTLVGDEKQSIYGFRGAATQVFRNWQQQIQQHQGHIVTLSQSFRTHQTLLETINQVFEPVLDPYQPLRSDRQPPHPLPPIQQLVIEPEEKDSLEQARIQEATAIAQQIQTWIQQPLLVWDKPSNQHRPIAYGDIAILCRRRAPLETVYGEVLNQAGIPVLVNGGGSLLETPVGYDLQALLEFLVYPSNDLALATLLRSPAFGLSDAQLYQRAQQGKGWWSHRQERPDPAFAAAIKILEGLLRSRFFESPLRLVQQFDRATGYSAVLASLPQAQRLLADWQALLTFLREQPQAHDLELLLRYWKQLQQAEVVLPRPVLKAGNAVTLMTLHGSKGSEWPVVIIPDLTAKPRSQAETVLFDTELGVALRQPYVKEQAAAYQFFKYRKQQAEDAETRRLLYVGFTRARDLLLLTSPKSAEARSPLDLLAPGLEQAAIQPLDPNSGTEIAVTATLPTADAPLFWQSTAAIAPQYSELSVSAFADYFRCPALFHFRYTQGHPGAIDGEGAGTSDRPPQLGLLVHRALELDLRQPEALKPYCAAEDQDLIPQALQLASCFATEPVYSAVREQAQQREVTLHLELSSGLVLKGRADLVGADWVLDFKTDQQPQPENYQLQLWAYAAALNRPQAAIAWLRHNQLDWIEIEFIPDQAERAAVQLAQGDFDPQPGLCCQYCSYRSICEATSKN